MANGRVKNLSNHKIIVTPVNSPPTKSNGHPDTNNGAQTMDRINIRQNISARYAVNYRFVFYFLLETEILTKYILRTLLKQWNYKPLNLVWTDPLVFYLLKMKTSEKYLFVFDTFYPFIQGKCLTFRSIDSSSSSNTTTTTTTPLNNSHNSSWDEVSIGS